MSLNQENLIKILGIESLPEDQKIRILDNSLEIIQQRLMLRLFQSLSTAKQDELRAVVKSEDQEKIEAFILENAPSYFDWMEEETNAVKEELKAQAVLPDDGEDNE